MNWRKNIVLVVGGGIALALFLAALVVLLKLKGRYNAVHGELTNAKARLDSLYQRDPFPSEENIAVVRSNLVALSDYVDDLRANLVSEQIEPEQIETAEFAPLLEKTSRRLTQRAAEAGVKLPERFAMGFSRYAAGALPAAGAVPRLVVQLKTIDAICNLLVDARVSEILSVDRTSFEAGAEDAAIETTPMPIRRRGQPVMTEELPVEQEIPMAETNELYGAERIKVAFTARDAAAWEALNALARSKAFTVVVDVKMENLLPATVFTEQKIYAAPQPGAVATIYPTHEERVVAGRDLIKVELALDVYRFTVAQPAREGGT